MHNGYARICLLGGLLVLAGCHDPSDFNGTPDDLLRDKVYKMVLLYDAALSGDCTDRKVVRTASLSVDKDGHASAERWTIDECGKVVFYRVTYTPDGVGGYNYDIRADEETQGVSGT